MSQATKGIAREQNQKLQVRIADAQYIFDRSGRFLLYTTQGKVVRRGLDHRMVQIQVPSYGGLPARRYRDLASEEKSLFLQEAYEVGRLVLEHSDFSQRDWWRERLSTWTIDGLATDYKAFHNVYLPVSILPPDQYHAVVVQVAHGCSYNHCLFCDFYRDRPFHIKSNEEVKRHIHLLREFLGERIHDRSGIFLGDGNALIIPTERLLQMMRFIREMFQVEAITTFGTFMDTFNLDHKSQMELQIVRRAGLETVYVGFETGSDRLRMFLDKPGVAAEAVWAINKLKAAGFRIGLILLIGAGGVSFVEEHRQATLTALAQIQFTAGDIVFLSPFYMPEHTPYQSKMNQEHLLALSDVEMEQELHFWKKNLIVARPAKITLYSIKEHLY